MRRVNLLSCSSPFQFVSQRFMPLECNWTIIWMTTRRIVLVLPTRPHMKNYSTVAKYTSLQKLFLHKRVTELQKFQLFHHHTELYLMSRTDIILSHWCTNVSWNNNQIKRGHNLKLNWGCPVRIWISWSPLELSFR